MTVRTRVAPSPTGDPHVGTAYQALFNYAFAKHNGGSFVLRIEDTDQARSHAASERMIMEALAWTGITWDEGPDVGGDHGPYRQSERLDIYKKYADQLLEAGHAYRCFATDEELAQMRAEQREQGLDQGYDRRYRDYPRDKAEERAAKGEPHVIRMKVPTEGSCKWWDLLRGDIEKDWASIDDQIILKSDGFPTYHLAVVVDDHLMGITHILRGEEWINSVPKHIQLYEYFGWEPPVFCHLPLLRNTDKSKLSKRKNPTSINYYRRAGFLPEALLNFLALAGWRPNDEEEKFSLGRMIEELRLDKISLGSPVFDVEKLKWLNGRYLREDYTPEQYTRLLVDWAYNADLIGQLAAFSQPRTETLADFSELTSHFFRDEVPLDAAQLLVKGQDEAFSLELLQVGLWELEKVREFTPETVKAVFDKLAEVYELKLRELCPPFYVAMSGKPVSTPLFDTMAILGPDMSRMRIRRAIDALGGLGKKKLRKVEKAYAAKFGD